LYVYSLKPPANPHKYEAAAARGEKIFHREGAPPAIRRHYILFSASGVEF
jgi:hypothetical protein